MLVFLLFNHFRLLNFHICGHNLVGNLSLHVCDFLNPPVGVSKKEYCTEKRKAPVVSAWRKNGVIFCLVANESLFIYALKTLCDSTAQSSLLCRKNLPFLMRSAAMAPVKMRDMHNFTISFGVSTTNTDNMRRISKLLVRCCDKR